MEKKYDIVTNQRGAVVPDASVTVYIHDGSETPSVKATIYSDNGSQVINGSVVITDPLGYFEFYAADGHYDIFISGAGLRDRWIYDILLEDPADSPSPTYAALAAPGGAALVGFAATGGIAATTVQAAIEEVVTDLAASGGAGLVGYVGDGAGSALLDVEGKLREFVSITDKGGIGDNATNNASAFQHCDALAKPIYVPSGVFLSDGYIPTGSYYGEGSIRLANVLNSDSDSLDFTFDLDPSVPTSISQTVTNYSSGALIEQSYNVRVGQNCAPNAKATESMVVAIGGRAMESSGTGDASSIRVTAIGANALRRADDAFSVTAVGDSACENGADMNRLVAVGSNAMMFAGDTAPQSHFHEFHLTLTDPYGLETRSSAFRTTVGASGVPANLPAVSDDAKESTALGRNALLHAVKITNDVAIGYNALAHGWNTSFNVAVGSSALRDGVSATNDVAIGHRSMELNQTGYQNVAIGAQALASNVHSHSNTAIGYRAAYSLSGSDSTPATAQAAARQNIAIGAFAMENVANAVNNVAVGNAAFKALNGVTQSTAVGVIAGELLATGGNNTFVGYSAGRLNQDGTNGTARTNATCVGYNARVSGDNQVQLGDPFTTVYVWGTVQNRSDLRDKADVVDTSLGLDFVMGLRPVEGRWDLRADYPSAASKDGSKKRRRLHQWFIAQEVKELCDRLGVEFGGYQDHTVNGGCDVLTLGYDEFIPPIVKTLQDIKHRQDDFEMRLLALEAK